MIHFRVTEQVTTPTALHEQQTTTSGTGEIKYSNGGRSYEKRGRILAWRRPLPQMFLVYALGMGSTAAFQNQMMRYQIRTRGRLHVTSSRVIGIEYAAGAPESENDNNIKDYLEEILKLQQQSGPDKTSSTAMSSTALPTKSASDVKLSRSSTMPGFSRRIVNEAELNKRPQTSSAKRKEKRRKRDAQQIM